MQIRGIIKMDNAQTQAPDYEIRDGNLASIYGLFVPSTINTGSQISADRITDEGLHNRWIYTANAALATKREGKLLLGIGLTPSAFNVVFGKNTREACNELVDMGYIHLAPAQKELVLRLEKSGEVVFVDSKDLDLHGQEAEYRHFPIRTKNYQKDVTAARMPLVSAGYGSGDILRRVMDNLRVNGRIKETRVFTINPYHAAEHVEDGEIVARASRLVDFCADSIFIANVRNVSNHYALRGVLLEKPAEGSEKSRASLDSLVI